MRQPAFDPGPHDSSGNEASRVIHGYNSIFAPHAEIIACIHRKCNNLTALTAENRAGNRLDVSTVQQLAVEKHGMITPGSKLEQWITWALQQADLADPLVESPQSILDEKDQPDFSLFR